MIGGVGTIFTLSNLTGLMPGLMQHANEHAAPIAGQAIEHSTNPATQAAAHAVSVAHGPWWVALIPGIPLAMACVCLALAFLGNRSKLPAILTVAGLGVAFALAALMFMGVTGSGGGATWGGGPIVTHVFDWIHVSWGSGKGQHLAANASFYADSLTCLWMLFVTGLAAIIGLYASEYVGHDLGLGYCRFFGAFNLFVFSMACLVMGDNLLMVFLGWEGVGLCSYLLIGYYYKKPSAVAAAKKAFIMNRIGDLGLVLGALCTFAVFGTIELREIFASVDSLKHAGQTADGTPLRDSWIVWAIPLFFTIGAFGKSAQLFFYTWLPDAMEGPTPVSALIHAATMVTAGVYLIARLYPLYTLDPSLRVLTFVAWSGAITALWSATIGMSIFDIKRVMGYSTISQLGFMFAGLGVLSPVGASFHTFTHAFFKATLFLGVGAVMHGFGGQLDLRRLSGVMKVKGFWVIGLAMLIGGANLAGVPFTAGFFSKDMILAQAFTTPNQMIGGANIIGWILLFTAGLTAYYTFRAFFRVFMGPVEFTPGDEPELVDLGRHPKGTTLDEWHAKHPHGHGHGHWHGHDDHGHGHGHDDHGHAHASKPFDSATEEFTPHAPGMAINAAVAIAMALSILAAALYFVTGAPGSEHGGWVGGVIHQSQIHASQDVLDQTVHHAGDHGAHAGDAGHGYVGPNLGTFLGMDAHKVMYYVSAGVGALGILIAAFLHGPRGLGGLLIGSRERAAMSRADGLAAKLGAIPKWGQNKWYIDELYNAIVRVPLLVLGHLFHLVDKLLVDGIVDGLGKVPRLMGESVRPSQSGVMHGYAAAMVGGIAVLIIIVLAVTA